MKQYHDLMNRILEEGVSKEDRTGTGTKSIFGHQLRFNLAEGFPVLKLKNFTLGQLFMSCYGFCKEIPILPI